MQTWFSYILGYFFAIIIGHWCISWVVNTLWSASGWLKNKEVQPFAYTPSLVGLVERALYVASLQFGRSEFIAVWLAMKVAGQWKKWEEGANVESGTIPGRAFYNFFLIGTGFSIAYAFVGFLIISSISTGEYLKAIIPPTALIAGTVFFVMLTKYYQRKHHRNVAKSNSKSA